MIDPHSIGDLATTAGAGAGGGGVVSFIMNYFFQRDLNNKFSTLETKMARAERSIEVLEASLKEHAVDNRAAYKDLTVELKSVLSRIEEIKLILQNKADRA